VVGSDQVRNRATVGGNICTASPCADTPPALYVLEAIVLIRGKSGERRVPIRDFATFVRKTVVQKGELVVGLLIPKPANGTVGVYEKLSRRKGSDLAVVSTAALAEPREGGGYTWRIALGAVAPTIIRAPEAEAILSRGHTEADVLKAAEAAALASRPISDVRASEVYRRTMVRNVTRRAIQKVLAKLA
jgi:carbon-monoxide dehydrogenase medium subunit